MQRRDRSGRASSRRDLRWLALALALVTPAPLWAQSGPGPVPAGPGRITGRVVHPDDPAKAAGVPVALYGLAPGGESGVADTTTDPSDRFAF